VAEHEFNQKVARLLFAEMLREGYTKSFMISDNDNDVELVTRADIANGREADLLLSIHHDSVQPRYLRQWTFNGRKYSYSDKYKGFSIFYSGKNGMPEKSLSFARILGAQMLKEGFSPSLHHAEKIEGENRKLVDKDRGIYEYDDLTVLKKAKMAAVLLECGIIVNRDEEERLWDPTNRRKIALAILRSLDDYCRFIQ
jgi:N-acetylmuramoyl-L-alanine amidase